VTTQFLDALTYNAIEVPAFTIEGVEEGFQGQGMELAVT